MLSTTTNEHQEAIIIGEKLRVSEIRRCLKSCCLPRGWPQSIVLDYALNPSASSFDKQAKQTRFSPKTMITRNKVPDLNWTLLVWTSVDGFRKTMHGTTFDPNDVGTVRIVTDKRREIDDDFKANALLTDFLMKSRHEPDSRRDVSRQTVLRDLNNRFWQQHRENSNNPILSKDSASVFVLTILLTAQ